MNTFSLIEILWLIFTLICVVIVAVGIYKVSNSLAWNTSKKNNILLTFILFVFAWMVTLYGLAENGFFANTTSFPPRIFISILIPAVAITLFSFSPTGIHLLRAVPAYQLILMQAFRIGVEFLIWYSFIQAKLPVQMTFEGKNLDIFSGILALPVGYYIWKNKKNRSAWVWVYNLLGIGLLLNILIVAVLSFPTPFRYFTNEPSNIIISTFPYILLPGLLVPIAIAMHVFSLRKQVLSASFRD